jgi:ribosomal protein S12 methylthiotransferase accessory factor
VITDSPAPALGDLVSADVGIVHRLDAGMAGYDHPRLATAFASVCETAPIFGSDFDARAGGMAAGPAAARLAALGEAVERYSASHVPVSRLRRARVDELGGAPAAEPEWLDRRAAEHRVRWVPAHRLRATEPGEAAWAAASRVYLSGPDDPAPVAVPTSTGLACHVDPWQALYAGLLEVIERDAVMTSWLLQSPVTPLQSRLQWTAEGGGRIHFDRAVEEYRLVLLPSPVDVPVVLGLGFGADGQPAVAVGAAADLDLVRASRRALIEAHQTFLWATHMVASGDPPPSDPAAIDDLDEHVAYYLDRGRLSAFDFLRRPAAAPVPVDLDDLRPSGDSEQRCRELIGSIADAGLDCFAVDVTSPDVREAGLWVVRAIIPALYPLLVGTTHAPEHPRVPRDLVPDRDPHPFP